MTGISVIDRYIEFMFPASLLLQVAQLAGKRQVKAVVVRITALVTLAVVDSVGHTVDGILSIGESHRLTCVIDPVGRQADAGRHVIVGHQHQVVRAVVRRAVFLALADAFDGTERT